MILSRLLSILAHSLTFVGSVRIVMQNDGVWFVKR